MTLFDIKRYPLSGKTVLVRVNYDVPLKEVRKDRRKKAEIKVSDDKRIRESLPTIRFLLGKGCKVVLATHVGRPKGKFDHKLTTDPMVEVLEEFLPKRKIIKLDDCIGKDVISAIKEAEPESIILLENLRFHRQERLNNSIFAHSLARLADVYVNDAFSNSHRKHASMHAITKFLPSIPGFMIRKELQGLSKALKPRRPSVWVLGGAKLDKIDLIERALEKANYILIGGALVFSFLKAKGVKVGNSKIDQNSVRVAREILQRKEAKKIILANDFLVAEKMAPRAKSSVVSYDHIGSHQIGLDIGPESVKLFKIYLRKAHTIVWNGPLGYYEWANFAMGTKEIGRYIGKLTAYSVVGGGETSEAVHKFHLQDLDHVSSGGGASLELLSGKRLVAITALEESCKKFRRK
tara:strand:+ start:630 stop:1850 length:1221 start_codon:yes stop_codon:yes gene_type:complete